MTDATDAERSSRNSVEITLKEEVSLFYLHGTQRHRSNATSINPKSIEGFSSTLNGTQFSYGPQGDEDGKRLCLDVPGKNI